MDRTHPDSGLAVTTPEGWEWKEPHMTLRDYFAGQAMTMIPYPQGVGLNEYVGQPFTEYAKNMAAFSYRIADAMLAAREVK